MNGLPKVGIIYLTFPTKNGQRDIDRCLTSLEKLNYPKDQIELICVESKGNLPTIKPWFDEVWLPKSGQTLPRISYLFEDKTIGFAGNNNLGLTKAKELACDYVYLLNEDTDVDPDFLLKAIERAESDPKIAIVQSLILLGNERDRVNTVGNAFHYLGFGYSNGYQWTRQQAEAYFDEQKTFNPDLEIGYASGAGMLVRISALKGEVLFDEGFFMYHEDTDISLRVRLQNLKTVVETRSVIWHYYEFAKSKINYYLMERNRYVLMLSYYRWWTLFLLLPIMLVMDAAILVFSIKGQWADMKLKVYGDFLRPDFWRWIKTRRIRIQRERLINDREFLRLAISTIEFQGGAVKNPVLDKLGNPLLKAYWWLVKQLI